MPSTALLLFCRIFYRVAITELTATLLCIRAAYTMLSTFFCFIKIHCRTSRNKQKNYYQNYIYHHTPTPVFFEPKVYSSLSFLLVLEIIITTIAAITATAIPPAIAAPTFKAAGAVISVPIV